MIRTIPQKRHQDMPLFLQSVMPFCFWRNNIQRKYVQFKKGRYSLYCPHISFMLLMIGSPDLNIASHSIIFWHDSTVRSSLSYASQIMRIGNVFRTSGTYHSIIWSVMNGWTDVTRNVNTVGGPTCHTADIYPDKCNNYHKERLHTYLITFIQNIHKT